MKYLLSVDGGISSGITLWTLPDDAPAVRVSAWQFGGGLGGFLRWHRENTYIYAGSDDEVWRFPSLDEIDWRDVMLVSEKFTPLNNAGFSLTMESVEPLRIEGAMVALGIIPDYEPKSLHWQRPAAMYWAGGTNLAERKKMSRKWLKEHDLLVPAKELGAPDNNDFVSSSLHALAWLRKNHRPTLEHYFG